MVRDKGAWTAFSFKNDKMLKDEVAKISEGKGANLVFEAIGGDVFKSAIEWYVNFKFHEDIKNDFILIRIFINISVAPEGKVIIAGFTSRDMPQLSMGDILQLPSFSLIGVSLLNYRNKMQSVYR